MSTLEAPQQHKQPSRKGKSSWRKHINLTEVESGLQSVREQVIHGGLIEEKPLNKLYIVDTEGSEAIKNKYVRSHKPLKVDEILARRSAIPALEGHKRAKTTDGVLEPSYKKRRRNGVSHRQYDRLKAVAEGGAHLIDRVINTEEAPTRDLWSSETEDSTELKDLTFVEKQKNIKAPDTIKRPRISLLTRSNPTQSVTKPKPASSYNPLFQDWDKALVDMGRKEVEAEKQRLREEELAQQHRERVEASEKDGNAYQTEEESAWEGFESGPEEESFLSGPRPLSYKTQAERNKIRKRKQEDRNRSQELRDKRKAQQARNLGQIAKTIGVEPLPKDKPHNAGTEFSSDEESMELRRRKFGKHKLSEAPLEITLPHELQDSLRRLVPDGNLLQDRFRDIQIQGKVETRKRIQQPKKGRKTFTEKWTYKDFAISV